MGRRLTEKERDSRVVIKKNLNEFGQKIYNDLIKNHLRENVGRLKQTLNYKVNPFNTIIFAQQKYGKWNTYKTKPSKSTNPKDYNPLLQEINRNKKGLQEIIVKEIKESLLYSYNQSINKK